MGALQFTSVIDSLGRQWGDPLTDLASTISSDGTYAAQLQKITDAGYIAASLSDVIFMYTDQFCADSSCFSDYANAFGFYFVTNNNRSVARTTTVAGPPSTHFLTGYGAGSTGPTLFLDPSVSGTVTNFVDDTAVSDSVLRGFMFYRYVATPEPSMLGLFGLGFASVALLSYRHSRRK